MIESDKQNPISKTNSLSFNNPDRFIEVCLGKEGSLMGFKQNEISRIKTVNSDTSAIILKDGLQIKVRLPYQDLKSQIYSSDFKKVGNELDLTEVTGYLSAINEAYLTVGEKVDGQGIYLGEWKPVNQNGTPLNIAFNLFAAPNDLQEILTYNQTVSLVSGLTDFYGYNGAKFSSDKELYESLSSDEYDGSWFIPTLDILKLMQKVKGNGELTGSFNTASSNGDYYPSYYWSCTEVDSYKVKALELKNNSGDSSGDKKNNLLQSTRLVRAVPKLD